MTLRVLINCPGGWTHGLDSPERGEGRWAQNFARALGESGRYEVHASSWGPPVMGQGTPTPVKLWAEQDVHALGPVDVYIDACWYVWKAPLVSARANVHVHWNFEQYLMNPRHLDQGGPGQEHYLAYVYRQASPAFLAKGAPHRQRTYFLPGVFHFGDRFDAPDPTRRGVLVTTRGIGHHNVEIERAFERMHAAVTQLRSEGHDVPLTWLGTPGRTGRRHAQDVEVLPEATWGIPYNAICRLTAAAGVNAALDGLTNSLDAIARGVPTLAWTIGALEDVVEVAETHGLLLRHDCAATDVADVLRRLITDPDLYIRYIQSLQARFEVDHTAAGAIAYFDRFCADVGLA